MLRSLAIGAVMLAVTACVGPSLTAYYKLPPATTVTLRRTLNVPADSARVFLQHGAVVAKTRLHIYDAHCDFELRQVSGGTARIEPDTFTVTRVTVGDEQVVLRQPVRYAALRFSNDDEGMPPLVSRYVDYWLHSPRQPQVLRLTCHGGFDFEGRAKLPTAAEIRAALGDYAALGEAGD